MLQNLSKESTVISEESSHQQNVLDSICILYNIVKHGNCNNIIDRFTLVNPEDWNFDKNWAQGLYICQDLRYFSDTSDHSYNNKNLVNENGTSDARLSTLSTGQKIVVIVRFISHQQFL